MTALHSLARLACRVICLVAGHDWAWVQTGGIPFLVCDRCEAEVRGET